MSANLDFLIKKYGVPSKSTPLDQAMAERYAGRLPALVLELWQQYGVGMWLDGKVQFCDPSIYDPIARAVCGGDAELTADKSHIYAYTAFGELFMWHETLQDFRVSLPRLDLFAGYVRSGVQREDIASVVALSQLDGETTDFVEDTPKAKLLFKRASKKLGPLDPGECYGFVPALALGGTASLESLKKVKALEHFAILAALGRPRIIDYGNGYEEIIRQLG